jgi:hypothetical protein
MVRSLSALVALALLAGCSSGEVKVGVDVAPVAEASARLVSTDTELVDSVTVADEGTIALERIRVLVSSVQVGSGCHDGSEEAGPFVVDLAGEALQQGAHRDYTLGSVASGEYEEATLAIAPLSDEADASSAELTDFRDAGASLLINGSYAGKPFQFAGHFRAEQGSGGPVSIDPAGAVVLAMTVNPASWFLDADGQALDPTDPAQHSAIAVAICKTLDTREEVARDHGDRKGPKGRKHRGGPERAAQPRCVE